MPLNQDPTSETDATKCVRARPSDACFACGPANPQGLQLRFTREEDGTCTAAWHPTSTWQGFHGIIHGGIVTTVLDEAMAHAVAGIPCEAVTAEIRVRLRRPVAPGGAYRVRGWVVKRTGRRIEAEAVLTGPDSVEHAHAWSTFLTLSG